MADWFPVSPHLHRRLNFQMHQHPPLRSSLPRFLQGISGVPARCAGDSFIRRMVSFRETERPAIFFPKGRLVGYPHNVTLTTYFCLKVSSSKTRQKDSFQIIKQIISLANITYTFFNYFD
ncbi:hypothetical protein LXL04_018703 [Taraxacum kok-saghyz]